MHQALRDAQIAFEYQHHLPFRGCGLESETAHTFADFALPTPWGYVLLEVDEEQHKAYDPSCDVRRDCDMAASVGLGSGHKLLVLRYNPDAFKIAGMTRRTTKKERHAQLIRRASCWRASRRPPLSLLRPGRGEQRRLTAPSLPARQWSGLPGPPRMWKTRSEPFLKRSAGRPAMPATSCWLPKSPRTRSSWRSTKSSLSATERTSQTGRESGPCNSWRPPAWKAPCNLAAALKRPAFPSRQSES